MNKIKLLFFFLLIGALHFLNAQSSQKINGISFVGGRNVVNANTIEPVIDVNANWVTLMPFGFMRELNTPQISYNQDRQWWGERKVGVKTTTALFHNRSLKVMIKPQIWIWKGEFTGFIDMKSEDDWVAFEKSYEKFILDYAKLAQEIRAELFCLGTELNNFVQKRPAFWNQLIKKVKKVYSGKLTYAENWDKFNQVHFWRNIDFIGIDAYFPLSELKTPGIEEMKLGWKRHKEKIKSLYDLVKKPVLFTEFGYRSVDFAAKRPWDSSRSLNTVNLEGQRNALQAIFEVFWKEKWFSGGFLWKWYDFHNRAGGKDNSRFTPQNKPAEQLIRQFYGGILSND